jgi:hypothetical protein
MPITLLSEPLLFCCILLDKMACIALGRKLCSDWKVAPAACLVCKTWLQLQLHGTALMIFDNGELPSLKQAG